MKIGLSLSDLNTLEHNRRNASDRRSYAKITDIVMSGKSLSSNEVFDYPCIDDSTIYRYADFLFGDYYTISLY